MRFFSDFVLAVALVQAALFTAVSYAGETGTHGGNAIVCFDDPQIVKDLKQSKKNGDGWLKDEYVKVDPKTGKSHVTSVEILDLLQAKLPQDVENPQPTEVVEMKQGESLRSYVDRIENRFASVLPFIKDVIEKSRATFTEVKPAPNGLTPIDDVGKEEFFDTDLCVRVTIIGQYQNKQKRYLRYDPRLFNHPMHSALSKAVSLLHEYIYRFTASTGAKNAKSARSLVGVLIRKNITVEEVFREFRYFFPEEGYGSRISWHEMPLSRLTYANKIAQEILGDFSTTQDFPTSLKVKRKAFESEKSIGDRLAKERAAITPKILKRYLQVWQQKVQSIPNVPVEQLKQLDAFFQSHVSDIGWSRVDRGGAYWNLSISGTGGQAFTDNWNPPLDLEFELPKQ